VSRFIACLSALALAPALCSASLCMRWLLSACVGYTGWAALAVLVAPRHATPDSTWLLKDCLGGNSKTIMLATIK
jgi:hypothetical protein